MATILCVDDEEVVLRLMRLALEAVGYRTLPAADVDAALDILAAEPVDLVISDYCMPLASGLDLLDRMNELGHDVPVIMLTGQASVEAAVAALKAGAIDYLRKPIRTDELRRVVGQSLAGLRARAGENGQPEPPGRGGEPVIIGDSEAIRGVWLQIRTVARSKATVLIEGESGTGKELVARAIHRASDCGDGPFVSVNCAALTEGHVESLLFGHEKGAFTGALRQVKGAFERALNGTVLLDEISELRLDSQARLLRVLQEREFERIGGTSTMRLSARVIATTNHDLAAEVRAGRFREDLFYRLSVFPIRIPPLRERLQDVPALVRHFLELAATDVGRQIDGIAPDALERLMKHGWPGNVRELAHTVERAVILATGRTIDARLFELVPLTTASAGLGPATGGSSGADLPTLRIDEAERILIERALLATGQNRTRAARLLGISVRTLRYKLNRTD